MIHVSFSDNSIDIRLPKSWEELDQQDLSKVYHLMGKYKSADLKLQIFRYFARLRIVRETGDCFLCAVRCDNDTEKAVLLSPLQAAEFFDILSFIDTPGNTPVRLNTMRGIPAVNAELHGVKFSDYISLENYYQGFLASNSSETLSAVASILYPDSNFGQLAQHETINIINWMAQIKNNFSAQFSNFFKPVQECSISRNMSQLEIMNNEIRILTGGDVTKEETVLNSDCWRALTELDFKAKEAEDIKKQLSKK